MHHMDKVYTQNGNYITYSINIDLTIFQKLFVCPDKDVFVYCGMRYQIFDQDATVQYRFYLFC